MARQEQTKCDAFKQLLSLKPMIWRACHNQRSRGRRLCFEHCEERAMLANFTVTSTADDGSAGTLRKEIANAAVSLEPMDTINFNVPTGSIIRLAQGAINIEETDHLIVDGQSFDITIEADTNSRIFNILQISEDPEIELIALTLTGGDVSEDGGGILTQENLTLRNSVVTGNTSGDDGGGIYVGAGATLKLYDTIVSNNSADSLGGAIFSTFGNVEVLQQSVISANTAGSDGGGIATLAGGSFKIEDSIIGGNGPSDGNTALRDGGGMSIVGF